MTHKQSAISLDRRDFLKVAIAVAGVSSLGNATAVRAVDATSSGFIDTNVYLSRWPLRRLPCDDTAALVAKLRGQNVTQAWVGSFDGLLHRDIAAVNARLADECRRHGNGLLVPFGSVNPKFPDWEDDLRRCAEEHRMPGIRLHPSYHGYKLDDPDFAKLVQLATKRGLIVQLALAMEDRRMMHPLLQVEPPDVKPLADVVKETPGLRLVLLNAMTLLRGQPLLDLVKAGEVFTEIAMLEGVGGVAGLLKKMPLSRLLFGSYAPFFYFESALLKLKESPLSDEQLRAIRCDNAWRLLAKKSQPN
ncbi:MAG: amidohydrolase family protein [Kiritimatiellae bacterium]|nr:amidohydrolase family protein [Kiritimatiellia bacterium]MDD5523223.1 amidohydrolase family protein [Kiritimatiellia bacterium]